jgi:hypothetical protein
MEGLKLMTTFLVLAAIAVTLAAMAGIAVDNLPAIHDLFSIMVFSA